MEYFRKDKVWYTTFVYSAVIVFGVSELSRSINFPLFKKDYGLSYGEQGTLLTTTQWCYIVMTLASTIAMPYLKYKKLNAFGYSLSLVGCLIVFIFDQKWAILIGFHIMYLGYGVLEIGLNCFLSAFFTTNTGLMVNVFHGMYGLGALLSPLIAGKMADLTSMGFRLFYIFGVVSFFLVVVYMLFLNLDAYYESKNPESSKSATSPTSLMSAVRSEGKYGIMQALHDPIIYLAIIALGLQSNVEMAASSWAVLYIQDVLHLDAKNDGAIFMTLFYVYFAFSRLMLGRLFERIGFLTSLQISAWGGLLFFVIGFTTGVTGQYFLMVTGLFVAIFWPCMMCVLIQIYGHNASTATSYVISIHCVFGTLLSLTQGFLNEYIGPAWGYRTTIPLSVIVSILVGAIQVIQNREESRLKKAYNTRKLTVLLHSTTVMLGVGENPKPMMLQKGLRGSCAEDTVAVIGEDEILSRADSNNDSFIPVLEVQSVVVSAKSPAL